jgi:hypothetical protein
MQRTWYTMFSPMHGECRVTLHNVTHSNAGTAPFRQLLDVKEAQQHTTVPCAAFVPSPCSNSVHAYAHMVAMGVHVQI